MALLDQDLYSSSEALCIFLATLSYWNYYRERLVGLILEKADRSAHQREKPFRVIDVGCGTGELSVILIEQLAREFGDIQLMGFDPDRLNMDAYSNRFSQSSLTSVTLLTSVASFEDIVVPWRADLVLCSHSLYQTIEMGASKQSAAEDALSILSSWLSEKGLLCLIMASANSWAYECKRECYETLGIDASVFAVAEDLADPLARHLELRGETVVDSYADLTGFSAESDKPRAVSWLSYFLRVDIGALPLKAQDALFTLVARYSIPLSFMPAILQVFYQRFPAVCGCPNPSTSILMHKEIVYVARARTKEA